ncbi:MAG: hypothetical protein ACK5MA_04590 [Parachlamydiaceae bacterium]
MNQPTHKSRLLLLDRLWCANSLLAAEELLPLCSNSKAIRKLALMRVFSAISVVTELLGLFLILYGAMWSLPIYFLSGVCIRIASNLAAGTLLNRTGAWLHFWWTKRIEMLRKYQRELSAPLSMRGFTDVEIQGIPLLPNELYNCELNSYPHALYLHFFTPLVCATALALHGDFFSSLIIGILGISAMPLGYMFYKEFRFRQLREQRLAQTAKAYNYLENSVRKHVNLTFCVNAISQLPLALFTILFVIGASSSVFANYLAFTLGLAGLSGLLAFQKLRVSSQQSLDNATKLLHALNGREFLFSKASWDYHIKLSLNPPSKHSLCNGLVLENFIPTLHLTENSDFEPLTLSISSGDIFLLQARSGYGKSLFLLALLHIIDHKGGAYLIKNGHALNVHELSQKVWQDGVIYVREADFAPSVLLVDIFGYVLRAFLDHLLIKCQKDFGIDLTLLAWEGSGNLMEEEIQSLNNVVRCLFRLAVLPILVQIREERKEILKNILDQGFNNESSIHPERVFCTLSSGEQRRFVNLLTIETAKSNPNAKLVLFDEPLAHLDCTNIQNQIGLLAKLQKEINLPILIISHHHLDELQKSLVTSPKTAEMVAP